MNNLDNRIVSALFSIFDLEEDAANRQQIRGGADRGNRAGVTSGKHLDPLAECIANELVSAGINPAEIYTGSSNMELPGWYRPAKRWDILAFKNHALVTAIELKSIGSSFGNNFNNRTEEALGSATDAEAAVKNDLFINAQPPAFAYVMVVRDNALSRRIIHRIPTPHFQVDEIFIGQNYLERFETMCSRMLQERLYQAIWLVYVDTENRTITEPSKALSYENFMKKLKTQVQLF